MQVTSYVRAFDVDVDLFFAQATINLQFFAKSFSKSIDCLHIMKESVAHRRESCCVATDLFALCVSRPHGSSWSMNFRMFWRYLFRARRRILKSFIKIPKSTACGNFALMAKRRGFTLDNRSLLETNGEHVKYWFTRIEEKNRIVMM